MGKERHTLSTWKIEGRVSSVEPSIENWTSLIHTKYFVVYPATKYEVHLYLGGLDWIPETSWGHQGHHAGTRLT